MTEEHSSNDINKALFINLVIMLSSSAMQQMGKLVNPLTNKTQVDLQGAQISIDMLAMLQAKTKGNLDKDEDKMLNDVLSSLQMNYVETAAASPAKQEEKAEDKGRKTQDIGKVENQGTKEEAGDEEGDNEEKKDPKFHKSYAE